MHAWMVGFPENGRSDGIEKKKREGLIKKGEKSESVHQDKTAIL